MALTTITTGPSAVVNGSITIPATTPDPTCTHATLQFDISQHLAGNVAGITATMEYSLDGGTTWNFLRSVGRDQGYAPVSPNAVQVCSIFGIVPGVGNALRRIRATLTTTDSVTTSMQIVQAAG